MRDLYSNDLAGAAAMARMDAAGYDDDRPTRAELEAEEHGYNPSPVSRGTGNPLIDGVNTALIWAMAWTPSDIAQTAPGVVAFTPLATELDRITAALTAEGYETLARDGKLYARIAQPHGVAS